jgi:hypothetical protein
MPNEIVFDELDNGRNKKTESHEPLQLQSGFELNLLEYIDPEKHDTSGHAPNRIELGFTELGKH